MQIKSIRDNVREHVIPINNILLATGTLTGLVTSLDFLSPYTAGLNRALYTISSALVVILIVAALAPNTMNKFIGFLGLQLGKIKEDGNPRKWLPMGVIAGLILFSGVGLLSVAKASQGGLLASKSKTIRSWQEEVLQLRHDIAEVKAGVDAANVKLDTLVADSMDPQKDVVARGYSFDAQGLAKAIEQNDAIAVGLFVKAGLMVTEVYPMARILRGKQPWRRDIISTLDPSMFQILQACSTHVEDAYEPLAERVGQYKRLCGAEKAVARIEEYVASWDSRPKPIDQYFLDQISKRKEILAMLRK